MCHRNGLSATVSVNPTSRRSALQGVVHWDFKTSCHRGLMPPTAPPCRTRVRNRRLCLPGGWSTWAWGGCLAQGGRRRAVSWEEMASGKKGPPGCPALDLEGGFHAPAAGRPVPDLRLGALHLSRAAVPDPDNVCDVPSGSPHSSQEGLRGPWESATGLRLACWHHSPSIPPGSRERLSGSALQISPQK